MPKSLRRKGASKSKKKRIKLIDNVEKAFKNLDNENKTKANYIVKTYHNQFSIYNIN